MRVMSLDSAGRPGRTSAVMTKLAVGRGRSNLPNMKGLLFRVTTGIAAAYHLLLGAALLFLPAWAMNGTARVFLGVGIEFDARLLMIGRFSSAYILAFGVMLALLCWKPAKLGALVVPALVLFGIRLANKLVYLTGIEETFGVDRGRSVFALVSLAVIFGVMAWTRPANEQSQDS